MLLGRFSVSNSGGAALTAWAAPLMHVASDCTIYIAAVPALDTVSILEMIRTPRTAMSSANLAMAIHIPDLHRFTGAGLPFRSLSVELGGPQGGPLARRRSDTPFDQPHVVIQVAEMDESGCLRINHDSTL